MSSSSKQICAACAAISNGLRVAFDHTCGLQRSSLPDFETEKIHNKQNHAFISGSIYKKYKELKKYKHG